MALTQAPPCSQKVAYILSCWLACFIHRFSSVVSYRNMIIAFCFVEHCTKNWRLYSLAGVARLGDDWRTAPWQPLSSPPLFSSTHLSGTTRAHTIGCVC